MKSKQSKVTISKAKPTRSLFSKTESSEKKATQVVQAPEDLPEKAAQNSNPNVNIAQLRESFDAQATSRNKWIASDYSELIQKLDRLQTEAFILKGKLLAEAKQRFFASNKLGWAEFCEQKLCMNYTTANQYIRVATEFDVTSHQYPNLGFEHFKALLPIEAHDRPQVLEKFGSGSVKALRTIVSQRLQSADTKRSTEQNTQSAKQLLKSLQMVHFYLASVDTARLSAQLKWQLLATCNQVANSLLVFAEKSEVAAPMAPRPIVERAGGITSYSIIDTEENEGAS